MKALGMKFKHMPVSDTLLMPVTRGVVCFAFFFRSRNYEDQ
jgi:hypothetical protein